MASFGTPEILIIAVVIMTLFGARRLPDSARALGRSMRIFKAETKGLRDDETVVEPLPLTAPAAPQPLFDPYTGQPIAAPQIAAPQVATPQPRFDAQTGQPLPAPTTDRTP